MSHIKKSCHTCKHHVTRGQVIATYEWVMSHMNASCHTWSSHRRYDWVVSHMNETCLIWTHHLSYEWVVSHMRDMMHEWHMHELCLTWVFVSHMLSLSLFLPLCNSQTHNLIWMSEPSDICMSNVSHEWVMSHVKVTHECIMSRVVEWLHVWMSHVTYERVMSHKNESCHVWMSHVTHE